MLRNHLLVIPCAVRALFYTTVAAASLVTGQASAQTSAGAVIAANRAAMIGSREGYIFATYGFAGLGLTGTASRLTDVLSGAYIENMSGGPLSIGSGYDGSIPWMKDFSGAFTPEEGGDRVELAVNQAYRSANQWWKPRFGEAAITYSGRETSDGATTDHLTVTPKGGKPFDAWFDVHSHLLVRVKEVQGFMPTQTYYSDYVHIGGLILPHVTIMDLGAGPPSYITLTLQRAELQSVRPLSTFACPCKAPNDSAIGGGSSSTKISFRLLNNHIYVPVTIDGKGPYTFIVDTGGHLVLAPHLAAELGAAAAGRAPSSGVGEKMATTAFAHVDEIALGSVRLSNQTAFVQEVYDAAVEGIQVDGMLGFELFRRFGVEIDYGRQTLTIFDPAHHLFDDAGAVVPFKFYDHLPDVAGLIDSMPARFDIDTGSRGELDLTAPFVEHAGLHAKYPNAIVAMTGWGVGGPVSSSVIRLPSLTLGSVRVDGPVAEMSDAAHGSFSDPNYDGNIGSALLKRFVVTFDYMHQRLYLKPAQPPVADVGTFDRSGMWLSANDAGYLVTGLDSESPATRAGIESGDVIIAIDGKPAQMADLSDVRERLRTYPAGKVVRIEVVRGTARKTFDVTLRDLIPPADRTEAR